ncbi:hypothetical protein MMC13_000662 [Lambiella insularis]|nr:hypothetical protein [Lambiella insularis]
MRSTVAGALFGAALTAAAMQDPAIITSQMHLRDYHLLKVFLLASASSALVIPLLNAFGFAKSTPRSPSTVNLFGSYDANILGGAFLGAGMTLSSACPGTLITQVATGVQSGYFALLGAAIGGTLWSGFGSRLKSTPSPMRTESSGNDPPTVQSTFNLSDSQAVVTYESVCLLLVLLSTMYGAQSISTSTSPLIGGLLVGVTQASSLIITGNTLGTSSAYEEMGHWVWHGWHVLKHQPGAEKPPSTKSLMFVVGILGGSWTFSQLAPASLLHELATGSESLVSKRSAMVGGCMMILGARLAGGCTSGHGISGMATMGVASFLTVAAMFAGGLGMAIFF